MAKQNSTRRISTLMALVLLLLAAHLCPGSIERGSVERDIRPNILFSIADDQLPFDLTPYNPRSEVQTPNIERLAAEGIDFDAAHHMGAWVGGVCTSSRHMVMTGRIVWHIPDKSGRTNNPHVSNPKLVPPNLPEQTMAVVFNRAGYETMRTCKNGNSYEAVNKMFTVRHDATKRGGADEEGKLAEMEALLLAEMRRLDDPYCLWSQPEDGLKPPAATNPPEKKRKKKQ